MFRTMLGALALALALVPPTLAGTPTEAESGFLSQADCFAATPDYAAWLDSIAKQPDGPPVSRTQLEALVPERAFAFARTAFDCRIVSYASGGHTVSGYWVQPKAQLAAGKLPLLVYNRGGNGDFGRLDSLQLFLKLLPLARAGYVVVASQYRDADEFGGEDVDDVMRLIDLSLTQARVDAGRIFLIGQSRGAMMSYLVARRRGDITAMATIAGVSDLLAELSRRPEMETVYRARIPGYPDPQQATLVARSALRWAEQLPAGMPVLLLHGDADDRVHVENSRAMAARLQQLERPHKLIVYPGDNHGLQQNWRAARTEILNWFKSAKADGERPQ